MHSGEDFDTLRITISNAAIEQIKNILLEDGSHYIRVFVQGGGCSGFSYGFMVETESTDDDMLIRIDNTFGILIDPMSLQYLQGSNINYQEDNMGASFRIENPNAQTTCGCGSSFSPW